MKSIILFDPHNNTCLDLLANTSHIVRLHKPIHKFLAERLPKYGSSAIRKANNDTKKAGHNAIRKEFMKKKYATPYI